MVKLVAEAVPQVLCRFNDVAHTVLPEFVTNPLQPVFDTLLRVLDKKGIVQRTQLLAKLSQLVPTGSRAASH